MQNAMQIASWLGAAVLLTGCFGTPRELPRIAMSHGVLGAYEVQTEPLEEVWIDDELVGFSEAMNIVDLQGLRHARREVLDPYGQSIGYIDNQGRVFRYRLFEEPEHLTTAGYSRAVGALFDRRDGEATFRAASVSFASR